MSESETEQTGEVTDDQLPEDLRPSDDNPLAQPLDEEDAEVDDLDLMGGGSGKSDDDSDESDASGTSDTGTSTDGESAADDDSN